MSKRTQITKNISVNSDNIQDVTGMRKTIVWIEFKELHGLTIKVPIVPMVKVTHQRRDEATVSLTTDYTDDDMKQMFEGFYLRNWKTLLNKKKNSK